MSPLLVAILILIACAVIVYGLHQSGIIGQPFLGLIILLLCIVAGFFILRLAGVG